MAKKRGNVLSVVNPDVVNVVDVLTDQDTRKCDYMRRFIGQKVAILAARYQYRGVLSHVGTEFVVLSNPTAVEVSGANANERPDTEDPIGSDVCLALDAIEIFYQPNWVFAPLPGE